MFFLAKNIQAFVVGHDWGAQVAWYLCLFRPDRVKALVNMGVIYRPPSPVKPLDFMTKKYGEGFYISQFQEPGRAERSFSRYDYLTILKKFLLIDAPDLLAAPPGTEIIDFLNTPASLLAWITEEELQKCASKFEKTGFTGALNYYRAMDLNWELLGPWREAKINVPTKFIVGNKDVGFESFGTKDHIEGEGYKSHVPNMEVVVIDGHHFIHQSWLGVFFICWLYMGDLGLILYDWVMVFLGGVLGCLFVSGFGFYDWVEIDSSYSAADFSLMIAADYACC
ncbi:hypothetical protein Vadar_026101 [Vaccinium darrowii]|uniref:Uncharacterized protein n=1 Tax=Vaccinium darrowii TaxID=229202 RepID=A0ACB7XTC0_9ERIC|nr:hypothetical protein Vadar_026101 [Vaccinium darrowii]